MSYTLIITDEKREELESELGKRSVPHYEIGSARACSGKVNIGEAEILEI